MGRVGFIAALALTAGLAGCADTRRAWFGVAADNRIERTSLTTLPNCADDFVGTHAMQRFNTVEDEFWGGRLRMEPPLGRLRPAGVREERELLVARRWCEGTARFSDGRTRRFVVEMSAATDNQQYGLAVCVDGLDRHMAYQPACRVLRDRDF